MPLRTSEQIERYAKRRRLNGAVGGSVTPPAPGIGVYFPPSFFGPRFFAKSFYP